MLQAMTKEGEFIQLINKTETEIKELRTTPFYCPVCSEKVIMKAGRLVAPHFAHYVKANCLMAVGGESEAHIRGKKELFHWLQKQKYKVSLEHFVKEIKQIPDIMLFFRRRKIAIEFQCSIISVEEVSERNQGYKEQGILPIWFLHIKYFKRLSDCTIRINSFLKHFIFELTDKTPATLLFFCPERRIILLVQHLYFTSQTHAVGTIKLMPLNRTTFAHIFSKQPLEKNKLMNVWKKEKFNFRMGKKEIITRNRRPFYEWLYNNHLHIEYLPNVVYLPVKNAWMMKVPIWEWQTRLCVNFLSKLNVGDEFHKIDCLKVLKRYLHKKETYPLVYTSTHPVTEYLAILSTIRIIHPTSNNTFKLLKNISYLDHIEHSIEADKLVMNKLLIYNEFQHV